MNKEINILIVDDSEFFRQMFKTTLMMEGYNVFEAENGIDAFKELKLRKIDLLIVDLNMPVMSGESLIKTISSLIDFNRLPIIIISGEEERLKTSLILKNVIKLFTKPIKVKDVVGFIQRFFYEKFYKMT